MLTFLKIFQLIISVLLIISILLQNKATGFSSGMSSTNAFQATKRGAEKVIFNASIVFAVLFVLSSLAFIFVA